MAMLDWNNDRRQLVAGVDEIGKPSPEAVKGYATPSGAALVYATRAHEAFKEA